MKDPRQRLASVMGKCFPTVTPKTRDELRHAVLSEVLGRAIVSSEDLTDAEAQSLLTKWEHYQAPFSPSDSAKVEINAIAAKHQTDRRQTEMQLT